MKKLAKIYQLKIELDHIQPSIWRRIVIADDTTLYNLHHIIQLVMGWDNCHLYLFNSKNKKYGNLSLLTYDNESILSDHNIKINKVITTANTTLQYEYDFGDSWSHTITLEKIIEYDPSLSIPYCISGERCCPPEDCGGIPGYTTMLKHLKNKDSQEHNEYIEWLGGKFYPEFFNHVLINEKLNQLETFIDIYEED